MFFKKKLLPAELVSLHLPYRGGEKLVRVYLPRRRKGEKLPVVYMTDGQSVFDEESNPLGCWHTREAVEAERDASGRSAIIVGIHSDPNPMLRTAELTPASIGSFVPPPMPPMPEGAENMPPMPPMPEGFEKMTPETMRKMMEDMMKDFTPDGEYFDEFVLKTVMPAVERKFPVRKGRENTAIIGSSSGGLEVFYIALSHPEQFCAVGALSPAFLYYSEDDIMKWTAGRLTEQSPLVCLYCGEGEPKEKQMCDAAKPVFELIKSVLPQDRVKEVISPEGIHNESAWEPVFKDFLHRFLN